MVLTRLALLAVVVVLAGLLVSPAAARVGNNSPVPGSVFVVGSDITFTVGVGPILISSKVVVLNQYGTEVAQCHPPFERGSETQISASCSLGFSLPVGTYTWANEWVTQITLDLNGQKVSLTPRQGRDGPFLFTVAPQPTPAPTPAPSPQPVTGATEGAKTWRSAARLPTAPFYAGDRSVKNSALTKLVHSTMREVTRPRLLAVACWVEADFNSVLNSLGGSSSTDGDAVTTAFWTRLQPRWLHLSPETCEDATELMDTKIPTGRLASSLVTVLHEASHAYGIKSEAEANCYAVQLVPIAARNIGMSESRAKYLGTLAARYTRRTAPAGYWRPSLCRDGGKWDFLPATRNLTF